MLCFFMFRFTIDLVVFVAVPSLYAGLLSYRVVAAEPFALLTDVGLLCFCLQTAASYRIHWHHDLIWYDTLSMYIYIYIYMYIFMYMCICEGEGEERERKKVDNRDGWEQICLPQCPPNISPKL